eukprot:TRINITY_DN7492_c0_g1_i1.p1 TRINITY_DN7492_c0_g1~~TRINITY_DN7492_c0_g1_i1.p1  ORF type:complete len:1012 (+),score=318.85 TRINITY_DN7492_c0_g1_i1:52-3036(+)
MPSAAVAAAAAVAPALSPVTAEQFEVPAKALGVSGGTAAFYSVRYKENECPAGLRLDHWVGKDLARARDELEFYDTAQAVQAGLDAEGRTKNGGSWRLLRWTFDYGGVITMPCDLSGKQEKRELLLIRNLYSGVSSLRLLDVKLGAKTAVGGWRGKGHIGAMVNQRVDAQTNTNVEGYRAEGFDGMPDGLASWIDASTQSAFVPDSPKKKMMRRKLQCLTAEVFFQWWLHLVPDAVIPGDRQAAAETAAVAMRSCASQLVELAADAVALPVPQQWIGSSVGLGYDKLSRPPRDAEHAKAEVSVFDWGRSELLTPAAWSALPRDKRDERSDHWQAWVAAVKRLSFEAARAYRIRYCPQGGWQNCRFRVYGHGGLTGDDKLLGQWTIRLTGDSESMTLPLTNAATGETSGATLDVKVGGLERYPEGSVLASRYLVKVVRASGLSMKTVYVTVAAIDGKEFEATWQTAVAVGSDPTWNEMFEFSEASEQGRSCVGILPNQTDEGDLTMWTPPPYGSGPDTVRGAAAAFTDGFDSPFVRQAARSIPPDTSATFHGIDRSIGSLAPQPDPGVLEGSWECFDGPLFTIGGKDRRWEFKVKGCRGRKAGVEVPQGAALMVPNPAEGVSAVWFTKKSADTLECVWHADDGSRSTDLAQRVDPVSDDDSSTEHVSAPPAATSLHATSAPPAATSLHATTPPSTNLDYTRRRSSLPTARSRSEQVLGFSRLSSRVAEEEAEARAAAENRSRYLEDELRAVQTSKVREGAEADGAADQLRTEVVMAGHDTVRSLRAVERALPRVAGPSRRPTAAVCCDVVSAAAHELQALREENAALRREMEAMETSMLDARAEAAVLRRSPADHQPTELSVECARYARQLRECSPAPMDPPTVHASALPGIPVHTHRGESLRGAGSPCLICGEQFGGRGFSAGSNDLASGSARSPLPTVPLLARSPAPAAGVHPPPRLDRPDPRSGAGPQASHTGRAPRLSPCRQQQHAHPPRS